MEFSIAINLSEIMLTLLAICGVVLAAVLLFAILIAAWNVIKGIIKGGKNGRS